MPNIRVALDDLDDDSEGSELTGEDNLDAAYHAAVAKPSVTFAPAALHGLPSEVVIAGRAYQVEVYTTGGEPTNRHDRRFGYFGHEDGMIRVNSEDRDEFRETLLHEVLHAVDHHAGTNAGEVVVNAWTPILLDVLRKNPQLVAVLLDE